MNKKQELAEYLAIWRLTDPCHIASTPRATVWRVRDDRGTLAALKIATGTDKASERWADEVYQVAAGRAMVRCLKSDHRAWLLEWVDGPLLGDVARSGDLGRADAQLVATCAKLHTGGPTTAAILPKLADLCQPLILFDRGRCQSRDDQNCFSAARERLLSLEKSKVKDRVLHGDYHHDNGGKTDRGWLAFDPKGVQGELAYEPANAFANPVGLAAQARQPDRIRNLADAFSTALNVYRARILDWAVVHAGLSMIWALDDGDADPFARLPLLRALLDQSE